MKTSTFDGEKDLAIQEFFSTKRSRLFDLSVYRNTFKPDIRVLPGLFRHSQGNYELDPASKTIKTMSSGGCCSHSSTIFCGERR